MRGERGFSLIEGMLAMAILATGLLGLASMQIYALGGNVDADEMTRVTNLGMDMVERIQFNRRNALAYNGIDTTNPCVIDAAAQPMARGDCDQWRTLLTGNFAAGLGGLRGQVASVAVGPAAPALNQSRVTVTMTWTGAAGTGKPAKSKRLAITTVVAPE